jgi:5-methyltetrahydropteroyltriglutamate--homocysteine methyltransferase
MAADTILTTHAGSLPRPVEMLDGLRAQRDEGAATDPGFVERIQSAVTAVVERQREVGIDLVNDGEQGKPNFQTYVEDRLSGFERRPVSATTAGASALEGHGEVVAPTIRDLAQFPALAARLFPSEAGAHVLGAVCTGPLAARGTELVQRDIDMLTNALGDDRDDAFMSAVSPGQIGFLHVNDFYASRSEYLEAIANAMRPEYNAIVTAGLHLQLDSPDLAMAGHMLDPRKWEEHLGLSVDALNHALEGIAPEMVRLHLCWGNYGGPHHHDVPLRDILPTVLKANVRYLYVEGANARHEHEWQVFKEIPLPDDMLLIVGVIDVKTNVVEHPRLVADRIVRVANVIGRERVIAATDCGFATYAGWSDVDPGVAWLKLEAMVEGAAIASDELW